MTRDLRTQNLTKEIDLLMSKTISPEDDKIYGKKNNEWFEIPDGGSGISIWDTNDEWFEIEEPEEEKEDGPIVLESNQALITNGRYSPSSDSYPVEGIFDGFGGTFKGASGYMSSIDEQGFGKRRGQGSISMFLFVEGNVWAGKYSLNIASKVDRDVLEVTVGNKTLVLTQMNLINSEFSDYLGHMYSVDLTEQEFRLYSQIAKETLYEFQYRDFVLSDFEQNYEIKIQTGNPGLGLVQYRGFAQDFQYGENLTPQGEIRNLQGTLSSSLLPKVLLWSTQMNNGEPLDRQVFWQSTIMHLLSDSIFGRYLNTEVDQTKVKINGIEVQFGNNLDSSVTVPGIQSAFSALSDNVWYPMSIELDLDKDQLFSQPTLELTPQNTIKRVSGRFGWTEWNSEWYYVVRSSNELFEILKDHRLALTQSGSPNNVTFDLDINGETHPVTLNHLVTSNVRNLNDFVYRSFQNRYMHFNQDISKWDVSNVTDFDYSFNGQSSFNQPLNSWDVSSATDMGGMFAGQSSFDQDLSSWTPNSSQPSEFAINTPIEHDTNKHPQWKS